MKKSDEQIVKDYLKGVKKLRKINRDPVKAREFLIQAGIAEACKSAPNGIRLAKRFR